MNKTLSVNIGGIVFHIEEHAYEKLNNYLESIRGYFTTSDGRDEIIQDIESRIGEMFQERITNGKQVIVISDVEEVINIMGKPEQFAPEGDETAGAQGESATRSERKAYRRLYRDPDDRVVGGVCSGISHYLGFDPLWLRLGFAISFFVFGTGFLLYILLMFIMPKAKTTTEKLEMKGEKVNISNITRTYQSEKEDEPQSIPARFVDALGELFVGFFRVIGKIFSAIFIAIGVLVLIAFGLAFLAIIGVGSISIPFFITDLFLYPWQQTFSLLGAFLVIGIPILYIVYRSVRSLFKIKTPDRFVGWSALALWIVGVILSIYVVSSVASEFRSRETQRTEIPVSPLTSDTLNLEVVLNDDNGKDWYFVNNHRVNDPWAVTTGTDTIHIESVTLDIVRSNSDAFELVEMSQSRGKNRQDAIRNARSLDYKIEQTGNTLLFDETFLIPKGSMYRGQSIKLVLKVPEGKSVHLSDDMDRLIYDIENVTNTYDGDMVGKTWTMTPNGLECIGCNLHNRGKRAIHKDVNIRIDDKGVKVIGADSEEDTIINLDGQKLDIQINDNGINIKSKKKK